MEEEDGMRGKPSAAAAVAAPNAATPLYGEPLEEEEESCLLGEEDTGAPPYSMHEPTTSHLDLTDATISQELHVPTGVPF